MKKIILIVLVAISVIACKVDDKNKVKATDAKEVGETIKADSSETYNVIANTSTLTWKGFKPTGSHDGTVGIAKGKISVVNDMIVGGKFIIDMNAIVCLDMPADNEYNAKLIGHLKAADFFDVEKFSTAIFQITGVENAEDKINVSGNLTVKGITKNITIPATFASENGAVSFKSDVFKIDRTEFGIEYKSTKLAAIVKDKSIDDLVEMSFNVLAQK